MEINLEGVNGRKSMLQGAENRKGYGNSEKKNSRHGTIFEESETDEDIR